MLQLGLIDAVWDVFVFHGSSLLRFHYTQPGHKDNVMARRYSMATARNKLPGMDWRGLVVFAVLVGRDYAPAGVRGCGPKLALTAVRKGLGAALVEAFKRKTLSTWRSSLQNFFDIERSNITVPPNFPDAQVLRQYIGIFWNIPIDHTDLRVIITRHFNQCTRVYPLGSAHACIKEIVECF